MLTLPFSICVLGKELKSLSEFRYLYLCHGDNSSYHGAAKNDSHMLKSSTAPGTWLVTPSMVVPLSDYKDTMLFHPKISVLSTGIKIT